MNSCRLREHICPVLVSQSIAVAHSSSVGSIFVHEAVQMLDQRLHDLPQARIGNVLPALKHHIGEVVFGHIGHGCLLESVLLQLFSSDYSTMVRSYSRHESITWVRLLK